MKIFHRRSQTKSDNLREDLKECQALIVRIDVSVSVKHPMACLMEPKQDADEAVCHCTWDLREADHEATPQDGGPTTFGQVLRWLWGLWATVKVDAGGARDLANRTSEPSHPPAKSDAPESPTPNLSPFNHDVLGESSTMASNLAGGDDVESKGITKSCGM